MAKQRSTKPDKKKGDVPIREGAEMEREQPRRDSPGQMDEHQRIERQDPSRWNDRREYDQNE